MSVPILLAIIIGELFTVCGVLGIMLGIISVQLRGRRR